MDSTCPGCGSMYNGNSQFCSRYCSNHNFDEEIFGIQTKPGKKTTSRRLKYFFLYLYIIIIIYYKEIIIKYKLFNFI